jgi:hypothetical protein
LEERVGAVDSTGVETDRYEVVKPSRRKRRFEAVRRIIHLKYHIAAIIDHLTSYPTTQLI